MLTGATNYTTWAAAGQLWFRGQGRVDHLTTHFFVIASDERDQWQQIDALLCTVLWFFISPNLQHSYQAFDTCYDVWHKAKKVYANDVQHLYNVITTMMTTKLDNRDIQTYLSKDIHKWFHIRQVMLDEMDALQTSGTWELVPLPPNKSIVGCRWVYTMKVASNGSIDRF
uniref:Retrovirus-related Pol polyprotein from transposon TNT 1-94 n=1 Tax=Cajanus cajan TaxID=3821 RepID=A0A151RR26_CAJCA|nr:hypothetical protein KK1_033458 [Cajanus cajan]